MDHPDRNFYLAANDAMAAQPEHGGTAQPQAEEHDHGMSGLRAGLRRLLAVLEEELAPEA